MAGGGPNAGAAMCLRYAGQGNHGSEGLENDRTKGRRAALTPEELGIRPFRWLLLSGQPPPPWNSGS